jgi:hypothetical protein
MKTIVAILIFFFTLACQTGWSQARMVFQANPYVVINDGAYVVIDNPNPNAITNPAQGNIVSEDEYNFVKWNIGTSTGTYVIPFTTGISDKIPLTVQVSAPGSGGANQHILFSTYGGLGAGFWESDANKPSDVLHTVDIETGLIENSEYVIDRFWIIDCVGYTTRPSASLNIGYSNIEHTAPGNSIAPSTLGGQRYNNIDDVWGDYLPQGTADVGNSIVNGIPAPPGDFFRSWTLVSNIMPLPIELLSFDARCDNGVMIIKWSTATETNNDYFLLERSHDGMQWETVKELSGAGNSGVKLDYEVRDYSPFGGSTYYRLTQFDFNGTYETFAPIAGTCSNFDLEIVSVFNNFNSQQMQMTVSSSVNENFDLYVLDMSGKVLFGEKGVSIREGMNQLDINKHSISMGVYVIQLVNDNHLLTRKVALN